MKRSGLKKHVDESLRKVADDIQDSRDQTQKFRTSLQETSILFRQQSNGMHIYHSYHVLVHA